MTDSTATKGEPYVGKELSSRGFLVDEATLSSYYDGLGLPRPDQDGGIPLVPSLVGGGPDGGYFGEIAFSNHIGHLWMRQEWELFMPFTLDRRYESTGRITEIYQRRDRRVVQYAVELHDAAGELAARSQHHQSFLLEQQSVDVKFRDPKAKPGARKFNVPEGDPFGGLERTITLDMCDVFWQGDKNYHSNRKESEKLGFRDVVVGGLMTMPYAAHILEERYGAAWWSSGRLDLKFTNPVWLQDTVTAHGVELGPMEDDPGRTAAFVWLTKPDDTIVLVANASVASPD